MTVTVVMVAELGRSMLRPYGGRGWTGAWRGDRMKKERYFEAGEGAKAV